MRGPEPIVSTSRFKSALLPKFDVELGPDGVRFAGGVPIKTAKLVRLDRALCRHTSMKRIAGATFLAERQSIRLKARATAPMHNSDYAIFWGAKRVSVFYWDRDRVKSGLSEHGVTLAEDGIVLPSNFFEDAGSDVELRMHATGVELQIWEGGALLLSRWWKDQPTAGQVTALIEQLDLDLAERTPVVKSGARADMPVRLSWRNGAEYSLLFRTHLIALLLSINLVGACVAAGGAAVLSLSGSSVTGQQSALKPQELGIIEARKQSIDKSRWIETYTSIRGTRQHLVILEGFLQAIEPIPAGVRLESWEFEEGRLTATMKVTGDVDIRGLVKALEGHKMFSGVNSESQALQNNIKLTMTVVAGGKPGPDGKINAGGKAVTEGKPATVGKPALDGKP